MQTIYATDASVYRELPLAVAIPKSKADIKKIIQFASNHNTSIIPRAAGTSLAGQCVGNGIVVDVSKHLNKIIHYTPGDNKITVQPGIIRNQLNDFLRPHDFFFSPITSTANRATIGGMVGNNSSGTTSIQYRTTREHVLEIEAILSDGSEVTFKALSLEELNEKIKLNTLEGSIYRFLHSTLSNHEVREEIQNEFPKPTIHRRNTGYALDFLSNSEIYDQSSIQPFDICKILCGSEGTLAFITSVTLHLDPIPPKEVTVVAAHFHTIKDSLLATQIAMKHNPSLCELMDKIILDCTLTNKEQAQNRFFIKGDPAAVLMIEFRANTKIELQSKIDAFLSVLINETTCYASSLIHGEETQKVWALRSAGLGLLANISGDKKAVACIEDTAVDLADLPEYIEEFTEMMKSYNQKCVYYAHVGAGEIHLRPILDLKKSSDVQTFYNITLDTAKLVKKYNGSLSGEHGDGRVRASFIPMMVGKKNYALFEDVKKVFDPHNIFNPGKIINAAPMTESLRYKPDEKIDAIETLMDFSHTEGILRAAEKCNGSGDCRKLPEAGGTMCPSFHATRNEKDTTRARANALREFLTTSDRKNKFNHPELKDVMDLCLSCKACASECPSNVDMASMKAEFLHQYHMSNPPSWGTKAFANINTINRYNSKLPILYNSLTTNNLTSSALKKILGIAPQRSFPTLHKSLFSWYKKEFEPTKNVINNRSKIYFYCDEFTNYNDTPIGITSVKLLDALGYQVIMLEPIESGRAAISKGFLSKAKKLANKLINQYGDIVNSDNPLVGIEPSAILGFRDEIPRLVDHKLLARAKKISPHTYTIEEFIAREIQLGNITPEQFHTEEKVILLHGHCHQKALSTMDKSVHMLSLPINYHIEMIPSGCCGMAGSFGYEAEHFDVSQQIGETVLFPAIRNSNSNHIIAAAGTSCRHQILDGTGRKSLHPAEILYNALKK